MIRPQEGSKRVSAAAEVKAPDGSTFSMLRHAGEKAANIRGNSLVAMKELVEEREPESLHFLKTGSGTSSEYAMSSAIIHVKDMGLKADLVRISIEARLAEGHRGSAVQMLAYSRAAELDLPEFGEKFVSEQYELSIEEGNFSDAHSIANKMSNEGKRAIKIEVSSDENSEGISTWKERESTSFDSYARQILDALKQGVIDGNDWKIGYLFNHFRFSDDGYQSEENNPLAREAAIAHVKAQVKNGRKFFALEDASEAGLSKDVVKDILKEVSPDMIYKFMRKIDEKKAKILEYLPNQK